MGLSEQLVQAAVAVNEIGRGRAFYEERLGLTGGREVPGGVRYPCGDGSWLFVYESPATPGTAEHTVAGWYVQDLLVLMGQLRERGVEFEQYDSGTPTDADGVFRTETFRAAWVRDPDGNTLAFQQSLQASDTTQAREAEGAAGAGDPAPVVHVEIRGANPETLQAFYAGLAGWSPDRDADAARVVTEVSEAGRYGFVDRVPAADGTGTPAGIGGGTGHSPYAIFYLGVPHVAAAVARAEELGGHREMGPSRAPGRDLEVAHVRDPEGNLFGLAGPARD